MLQDDKIRISTVRRDKNYSINPHFHRHNELYYLEEGKSQMFVDTKLLSLKEGNLVFIKSGRIHKTLSGDNNSHVRTVVMFPDSVISEILNSNDEELSLKDVGLMVIYGPELARNSVKNILQDINKEIEYPDAMSEIMVKSYVTKLIVEMLRNHKRQIGGSMEEENMLDAVIRNAIEYICRNFNRKLTLEKAADYVNMSPTYFSKKFKKETGVGFKEYLSKYRLREAERLLKGEVRYSITDIATRCGFNDSNYFATAFKAEYGVSPNRFRHLSGG